MLQFRRGRVGRVILLAALALGGCAPLLHDDRCGPASRAASATAAIRDSAGTLLGRVTITLQEIEGGPEPRTLRLIAMGPAYADPGPLSGHVTRLRLLGRADSVLHEFAVRRGNAHEIVWSDARVIDDGRTFGALQAQLDAGATALEISTDLPGVRPLRVALPPARMSRWDRAHCS